MLRPKKTAEIILKYHPAVQLELQDGLRKSVTGWEEAEIESYPGELHRWRTQPLRYKCRQGKICNSVGA